MNCSSLRPRREKRPFGHVFLISWDVGRSSTVASSSQLVKFEGTSDNNPTQGVNLAIDFGNISAVVDAFKGIDYPFSGPTAPSPCP